LLFSHFRGMANARLGEIDRTRVMELLWNRKATVEVDGVYGIMASSGVELEPIKGETREKAWERWCEAAICKGHLRWIMLSPSLTSSKLWNCAIPGFDSRGLVSFLARLESVEPLDNVRPTVENGTFTVTGRHVGSCELIWRLGSLHLGSSGFYYREITFILFSKGRWNRALQVARAFDAGRYNEKQLAAIAHVMVANYYNALLKIHSNDEENFRPRMATTFQKATWLDFIEFKGADRLECGVGYLANFTPKGLKFDIPMVVATGEDFQLGVGGEQGRLEVLDFEALSFSGTRVLMIVKVHEKGAGDLLSSTVDNSFHKVGTTIPVSSDYDVLWERFPFQRFSIGGKGCQTCGARKEEQVSLPLQQMVSSKEQELIELKMRLSLSLRREWLVRRGILSRPISFMRFGKPHLGEEGSA